MEEITPSSLQRIYGMRFEGKAAYRTQVWQVLCAYFTQWIPAHAAVLDLGAGYCEFINNIRAEERHAIDLNPDLVSRAARGVKIIQQDCSNRWPLPDSSLDTVFTSNFLEHLPDKAGVRRTLDSAFRCLRPGGRLIAMGPNIKYLPGAYWDFFDHYVALTELSLSEALVSSGFEIERCVPRFLPYTMSQGSQPPVWMLRAYLAMPAVWPIFGKQFLVIARKPAHSVS